MPRVTTRTKSRRGRDIRCGRCGKPIEPGQSYFTWAFRYGGPRYRCAEHRPRPSELTQSKMAEVLAAIEEAEDAMQSAESVQEIIDAVEAVAQTAHDVAYEYEAAAEPFGQSGENQERYEMLEEYADGLDNFQPEEVDAEVDCDDCEGTGTVENEDYDPDDEDNEDNPEEVECDTCGGTGQIDNSDALTDAIEEARSEAESLINELPF